MNLVASLVVRNERARYLEACLAHLREFVDRIVVLDDASDDGTSELLNDESDHQLVVEYQHRSTFYRHEGQTRNVLLALAVAQDPTHILALDADELVTDGRALRALVEAEPDVGAWHLPIREVWEADTDGYRARVDGMWGSGRTLCWRVPQLGRLSFPNRALACGRVPLQIRSLSARESGVDLLHLGWLDESERVARVARYTKHDGGRFHASKHLASILAPRVKVTLEQRPWPATLAPWKDQILEHATVNA